MAELLLKVNPGANYEDGDILCCFNRRHIRGKHAEMICALGTDVNNPAHFNSDGLRPPDSLPDVLRVHTQQYKFQRVSETEVERITLADGSRELIGPDQIKVALYIERRRTSLRHAVFGTVGAEYWYGGNTDFSEAAIQKVWDDIQRLTGQSGADPNFELAPLGGQDVKSHLAIRTEDVTDEEAAELVGPEYQVDDNGDLVLDEDGNPIIAKKRAFKGDWRQPELLNDLKVSERDVEDIRVPVGQPARVALNTLIQSIDQPVQIIRDQADPADIDKAALKRRRARKKPRPNPRPVPGPGPRPRR